MSPDEGMAEPALHVFSIMGEIITVFCAFVEREVHMMQGP
jgi:hypothetical protein